MYHQERIKMDIGNQILNIRKDNQMTQDQFGELFHVTRQTVSSWENNKSYPDLQTLVDISNQFGVLLDTLLKEDSKMVESIDIDRAIGRLKRKKRAIGTLRGLGTGGLIGCLYAPDSKAKTMLIIIAIVLTATSWVLDAEYDSEINKIKKTSRQKLGELV